MNENPTWRLDAVSSSGVLRVSLRLRYGFRETDAKTLGAGRRLEQTHFQTPEGPQPFLNAKTLPRAPEASVESLLEVSLGVSLGLVR